MIGSLRRYLLVSIIMAALGAGGMDVYHNAQEAAAKKVLKHSGKQARKQARKICRKHHTQRWCKTRSKRYMDRYARRHGIRVRLPR